MAETGNSNQRVTNAILGHKLDSIATDVSEIKAAIALNTEHRITCTESWRLHEKEHASLNAKKWAGDIGAAVAGAVAGIAAAVAKS